MKPAVVAASACLVAAALTWSGMARAGDAVSVIDVFNTDGFGTSDGLTAWHGQIFAATDMGGTKGCFNQQGCGTVFRLSQSGGQGWTHQTLYRFTGGADGATPEMALSVDKTGAIYGYTSGAANPTVFRLIPPADFGGKYDFQLLYSFAKSSDTLTYVFSPLVLQNGHLYGIASGGASQSCGGAGCGSVFRLDPGSTGSAPWTKTTLYSFTGGADGGYPTSIVGFDPDRALYVSTANGKGNIVRLTPPTGGGAPWTEQVVAQFKGGADGTFPNSLVLGSKGRIYGLALDNTGFAGPTFQLAPQGSGGGFIKTNIYKVVAQGYGASSLAAGPNGSLIGVVYGDQDLFFGVAFQLTPPTGSSQLWTYAVLHNFNNGPDQNPVNIVTGAGGDLFSLLSGGGYGPSAVVELHVRGK